MLEKHSRHFIQTLFVDPIAKALPHFISPMLITLLAGFVGMIVPVLTYFGYIYFAILLLILSGYLDILDGSLARLRGQVTPFGTILDIITDRIVEFCAVLAVYLIYPIARATLCLAMLGSFYICITTFLVVAIFTENKSEKSFHYSSGLIERAETFIFVIAMLLFPSLFTLLASTLVILVAVTSALHLKSSRIFPG